MSDGLAALRMPFGRCGAGTYIVHFELQTPVDDAVAAAVDGVVERFVMAGNWGAFPAPDLPNSSTRLDMQRRSSTDANRLSYVLNGQNFDLFGFELLRNMSSRLLRQDIEVSRIAVTAPGTASDELFHKPAPDDESEYDAYPAMSAASHFLIERDWQGDHRARRCLVEWSAPIASADVLRLGESVAPWFKLLEAGAFALPVGLPSETDSVAGAVTLFDEQSCEITVNRFDASEMAWHALINMLDASWKDALQISKLVIE